MFTYCVTFRIADRTVNGKTYAERREMLIENARKEKGGFWEETTSFLLVESSLTTPEFAKRTCTDLSLEHDLVLVFDPSDMSASYYGALEHLDVLKSFFPALKKAP